jgi:hypothetical protein
MLNVANHTPIPTCSEQPNAVLPTLQKVCERRSTSILLAHWWLDTRKPAVLVFEDAVAGIASGKAAGMKVLAMCTTTPREALRTADPDFLVPDLSQ